MPVPVIPDLPTAEVSAFLPSGATQQIKSSGNKSAATGTATIPATSGAFSYLEGFEVTGSGATSSSVIQVVVTDGTWTVTYDMVVPAGVLVGATALAIRFARPLKSTAANTAISVTMPSFGSGNTNSCVNAVGYTL